MNLSRTAASRLRTLAGPALAVFLASGPAAIAQSARIDGELRRWHPVTLSFDGPTGATETSSPNPFLDFRLDVTFENGGRAFVVPGYFAADGDAGMTGADTGRVWRVHFTPDRVGEWTWRASFRTGPGVAVGGPGAGTAFDGASGVFRIAETDKSAPDFRAKGRLFHGNERYMRFAGTGEPFLEAGPNSPENLLAYEGFDGTRDAGGIVPNFLHRYVDHEQDFRNLGGGPTWAGGRGEGILGAISYIADQGMNSIYVISLTAHGDGDDVWPFRDREDLCRYDCSKLDQWRRVFQHANQRGVHVQIVLTETENEALFEQREGVGFFADCRKLYYREMIARFGDLLGVTWNIGEENGWDDWSRTNYRAANNDAQRRAFAAHLQSLDPYDHPIIVHTYHGPRPGQDQDGIYGPLTDPSNPCPAVDGASMQGPFDPATSVTAPSNDPSRNNHAKVREWIQRSTAAGTPWLVAHHEQMPASHGVPPDGDPRDPQHDITRKDVLWGTLMAGGSGVQYYFGYSYRNSTGDDLTTESWRHRSELWRQTRRAVGFFRDHLPFADMECRNELVGDPRAYCLAKSGEVYAVYLREVGQGIALDLTAAGSGDFEVLWFDPDGMGGLSAGSVSQVQGGGVRQLGRPAGGQGTDQVVLVRRVQTAVEGSGCDGASFPRVVSRPTLGSDVLVELPPTPRGALPIIVIGREPVAPIDLPRAVTCDPAVRCRFAVETFLTVEGVDSWQSGVPSNAALLGHSFRVQGAFVRNGGACVELTGAVELAFTR